MPVYIYVVCFVYTYRSWGSCQNHVLYSVLWRESCWPLLFIAPLLFTVTVLRQDPIYRYILYTHCVPIQYVSQVINATRFLFAWPKAEHNTCRSLSHGYVVFIPSPKCPNGKLHCFLYNMSYVPIIRHTVLSTDPAPVGELCSGGMLKWSGDYSLLAMMSRVALFWVNRPTHCVCT